jgi:preprotein translocase subunit SecE
MAGVLKKEAPGQRFRRWFKHIRAEMVRIQS